jgi:hypothetical protein
MKSGSLIAVAFFLKHLPPVISFSHTLDFAAR